MSPTEPPVDTTDQSTETPTQSALDLVAVETIRENGIIETPTAYAMLVEVEPRDWLTLSEQQRSNLYRSFLTYLRGVDFPTQFHTLTTTFDADQYFEQLVGAEAPTANTDRQPLAEHPSPPAIDPTGTSTPESPTEQADTDPPAPDSSTAAQASGTPSHTDGEEQPAPENTPNSGDQPTVEPAGDTPAPDGGEPAGADNLIVDSPLLEYGRISHARWLRSIIDGADVRDRRFFVAVGLTKGEQDGGPVRDSLNTLRDALPGGNQEARVTNEEAYLDEVWTRAQHVAAKLPRTEVDTTVIDDRSDVLDVLYHYYQGEQAPISFDHAALTGPDATGLVDPDTGEDIDLDATTAEATREAAASDPDPEDLPDRPTPDAPFGGRVAAEYRDRVDSSRLLSWYARHIGPIGTGTRAPTPRGVYTGIGLFVASLLLAGTALGTFFASARPDLIAPGTETFWLVREASYALAAASLPLFLYSIVGLLPTGSRARIAGLLGTGISSGAVYLFTEAYPGQWNANVAATTPPVKVYAAGLGILVIAVALAIAARRAAIAAAISSSETATNSQGETDTEPIPDGGTTPGDDYIPPDVAIGVTTPPADPEATLEPPADHQKQPEWE